MKNTDKNQLVKPKLKGLRVKSLRKALRYSRRAFSEKYQLVEGTLQNWEDGRYGGLTSPGAVNLATIFTGEGFDCKPEWLMFGVGTNPLTGRVDSKGRLLNSNLVIGGINEQEAILEELVLIQTHLSNPCDCILNDDAMQPAYWRGDHVAGERCYKNDMQKLIGKPVIAQTQKGEMFVRILEKGDEKNKFNLVGLNQKAKKSTIKNVELFSVAPILWLRRRRGFWG